MLNEDFDLDTDLDESGSRLSMYAAFERYVGDLVEPLVGGTITGVVMEPDDEANEGFGEVAYGLEVKCADGMTRIAWVLMDEEGNGPGALDIEDVEGH